MEFSTDLIFQSTITLQAISLNEEPIFDVPLLNKGGYRPFIGTLTGILRILGGIIHTIIHLAAAIFDCENRKYHLQQAGVGTFHILRGSIEIIPIIGSLTVLAVDTLQIKKKLKDEFLESFPEQANKWRNINISIALFKGYDVTDGVLAKNSRGSIKASF